MRRLFIGYDAWKKQDYLLNKMTLKDLVWAYVTYPGIQTYAALFIISSALSLYWMTSAWGVVAASASAILLYPLIWYCLHRFLLHSKYLYRSPLTASLWKRIHFDHHQYPNDLSVLFGGLQTTLPTIAFTTGPVGWLISGPSGAMAALATGIAVTCFYEYCHCTQHLAFEPKSAFLQRIKKLHLAHHYHNENGNYGITDFFWDKALGTHYPELTDMPRSATVRNLGYTDDVAETYPWVAQMTRGGDDRANATNAGA
ncbi:MAG: sterol desaturase family protein [Pseudomonadota bacterium]